MTGPWLLTWPAAPGFRPGDRPVLVCVPPAGAGCGQFRAWQDALGDAIVVAGVQLPGRETRWADPPPADIAEVVGAVTAELAGLAPPGTPVVIFGHSFGGLLGYEIARALGRGPGWPRALVVAACRPPHLWLGAGRGLSDDDDELARLLAGRQLSRDDVDDDSREFLLEVLRLDARLSLTYTDGGRHPVGCRLEAWGGRDDATVRPGHVAGWRGYAGAGFRQRLFAGGHYFCLESPDAALAALRRLAGAPAGPARAGVGAGAGRHPDARGGPPCPPT
jgi:surfactin synthase thioesterase subunit